MGNNISFNKYVDIHCIINKYVTAFFDHIPYNNKKYRDNYKKLLF